jgi:hypothetical protein
VTLGEPGKVGWCDIFNTPFVNNARRDVPGSNKVTQPLRGVGIKFVVVSGQSKSSASFRSSSMA